MNVHEYIIEHWHETIREDTIENSTVRVPYKYTSPCRKSVFQAMFYWDTYFTNLGLLKDGREEQVKNNLGNMAFLISRLGYMPNATNILFNSQPPLFTRGVYDYYMATHDKEFIIHCLPQIEREFNFFKYDRMTIIGLNAHGTSSTIANLNEAYYYFKDRVGLNEDELKIDKAEMCKDMYAIAETGWDFNPRFKAKGNRYAASRFAHLDLNCLLYDAEKKASFMFSEIGDEEKSKLYEEKAEKRKELINKYLYDKEKGIYLDYNYIDNEFSGVVSAISFYPYAVGISDDKEGAKKVLDKLLFKYGLSSCEFRGEDTYWQWDYPNMWPSNVYFAYVALKRIGLNEEAKLLREIYMSTVEKVFEKTGDLWEKYNVLTCDISVSFEYDTPEMLGWTAGVYQFLYNEKD